MEPYTVTSPSTEISLTRQPDGTLHGTGAFTVTNKTGRVVRARVDAASQDPDAPLAPPAPPSWFSLNPRPAPIPARNTLDCDFAPDQSHQFNIEVTVPDGVAPAVYGARPFAATNDKPDEVFSYGDAWRVTVPPAPAPPDREIPWWIFAVAAVVLLLIVFTIWRVTAAGKSTPTTVVTTSTSTSTTSTTLAPIPAPLQLAPPDGAVIHAGFPGFPFFGGGAPLVLQWEPVPGATSYLVEVQTCQPTCSGIVPQKTPGTFFQLQYMYTGGSYILRWRVSANIASRVGATSPWRSLQVVVP